MSLVDGGLAFDTRIWTVAIDAAMRAISMSMPHTGEPKASDHLSWPLVWIGPRFVLR